VQLRLPAGQTVTVNYKTGWYAVGRGTERSAGRDSVVSTVVKRGEMRGIPYHTQQCCSGLYHRPSHRNPNHPDGPADPTNGAVIGYRCSANCLATLRCHTDRNLTKIIITHSILRSPRRKSISRFFGGMCCSLEYWCQCYRLLSPPTSDGNRPAGLKTTAEWKKILTPERFYVTRRGLNVPLPQPTDGQSHEHGEFRCVGTGRSEPRSLTRTPGGSQSFMHY